MFIPVPYDQTGTQMGPGKVLESKNQKYLVGSNVVSQAGWCDYAIVKDTKEDWNFIYKLPELDGLSIEAGICEVGVPGAAAYFGLLEIWRDSSYNRSLKLKVLVSTGSDAKEKWLEEEIGFDKTINYKTTDIVRALKEAAPNGVDCYFDYVGCEIIIITQVNKFGRVTVCGGISSYNSELYQFQKALMISGVMVINNLSFEGFSVARWDPEKYWPQAFTNIIKWIKSGQN